MHLALVLAEGYVLWTVGAFVLWRLIRLVVEH